MTSAAPGATSAAPNEPAIRRLLRATEIDTRMLGMIGALVLIWVGFNIYTAGPDRREPVPDAAQSLEPVGPDLLDRHHGDRHGAGHRHAPHRPVGRIDHRLRLDHHRRRAGPHPAGLSRPRQSGDLDHRGHHRAGARRGDRRLSRLARRLSRHSRLHRHPRRPVVLARRSLVGDDRPDHRAARRPLRPHGRRPARLDRRNGELGALPARLRGHRLQPLRRAPEAGALPFPAAADVGRIYDRRRRLPGCRRRDRGRERLSVARARRRAHTPKPITFPCRRAACSFRPATRFRC